MCNKVGWKSTGSNDLLPVIDVMKKGIQCLDSLRDASSKTRPFSPRNNPRNDIKGNESLRTALLAVLSIDIERDARESKQSFRLCLFFS